MIENIIDDPIIATMHSCEEDATNFSTIANNIISEPLKPIDEEMAEIYNEIILVDYPAIDIIEKHFLKLSALIYSCIDNVEKLGIFDDVSKAKAKESYNNIYLNTIDEAQAKKPTAAELTAKAERGTIVETSVNTIYSRSYKMYKSKIDAAQGMVSTLSKVLSKRMQEAQFSINVDTKSERKILNEGNIF